MKVTFDRIKFRLKGNTAYLVRAGYDEYDLAYRFAGLCPLPVIFVLCRIRTHPFTNYPRVAAYTSRGKYLSCDLDDRSPQRVS